VGKATVLLELGLGVRMALLVVLVLFTIWCTARGMQNGIWLLILNSMWPMLQATLFREGSLPLITLERVVGPLVLLMFIVRWKRHEIDRLPLDSVEWCMIGLLLAILVNMYMNNTYATDRWGREKLQFFTVLTGFFFPYMCYFIMRRGISSEAEGTSFLMGIGLITIYLGVTSLAESWHQNWLVFPKYILDPTVGIHYGKARGPFVSASANGVAMAMGLPILLWLFFGKRNASRWLWLVGIASVALSLPYVLQRAAWLSAAAALGVTSLAWPKRGSIVIGTVLLSAAIGGLLLPKTLEEQLASKLSESDNIVYRVRLIESSWKLIGDNLITGIGFDQFDKEILKYGVAPGYTSHNTLLSMLAEMGLLGFLPYVSIFGLLLFKSAKAYLQLPRARVMVGGMWGITAAYMITSMTVNMHIATYPNELFFSLWALVLALIRKQSVLRQEHKPAYSRIVNFA
jgi:O-antigen ligase